jgi:hypothetical protein
MVSSAVRSLTPWLSSETTTLPGATAATLSNTICRMAPLAVERSTLDPELMVAQAVAQLVNQTLALRSPLGGWPAHLPQTADQLAPYLSEETWELLEALDREARDLAQFNPGPPTTIAPDPSSNRFHRLVPITDLVPHLLWMLASGGYEIMRLIEGVQSRVYSPNTQGTVQIVRLVPVLVLTLDEATYALDLVTQTDPEPPLYLPDSSEICLLDNDLDSQPLTCGDLLAQIATLVGYTQPGLTPLLGEGCAVDALRPFQLWQGGYLRLRLHLAEMEPQGPGRTDPEDQGATPDALYLPPGSSQTAPAPPGFTLDDFANTLGDGPADATAGVLGDWLTFTDESWIQTFLSSYAQQVISQHLAHLRQGPMADREVTCNHVVYGATDLVHGANGLFKHTFVHEPVLVADVWPRLRWYLAQSSERVMQLMGGVAAQVLPPGLSWQRGRLYLRPLLQITTDNRSWILDLSRGRLLPTTPQALPATAAVDIADAPWRTPLTIADLTGLIDGDLGTYTPAIATLRQGTSINLHRLEGEAGCQAGQLTLAWCFTLQTSL